MNALRARGQATRHQSMAHMGAAALALAASMTSSNANAADPNVTPRAQRTQAVATPQRTLTAAPIPPLQVTVPYTKLEVVYDQPLTFARGGLVPLTVKYTAPPVASVQVPGALSYPIGPFPGGFEYTIQNADVRALLKTNEQQILERCKNTLDYNKVDVIDTVHDATIPFTVNGSDGAVFATTNVAYQVGLTCKRPLVAKLAYTKIEYDINQPLSNAKGGLVPFTVTYNGAGNVASVQVPGSLSYPLGAHQGAFEQVIQNADMRAVLKRDEAAILDRCKGTLEYNKATVIDTVHDANIPVTVNAADGTVVASTTVAYQLGLTCRR